MIQVNLRPRAPDYIAGGLDRPYLFRWTLARWRGWQLALHKLMRDDDSRALHDHVGDYWSLIIWRGYFEVTAHDWQIAKGQWPVGKYRHPFIPYFRDARTPHRLVLKHPGRPTWTLWLRGPKVRQWGFHTAWGWVSHDLYDAFNRMKAAVGIRHLAGFTVSDLTNRDWIKTCGVCGKPHDLGNQCLTPVSPCQRCTNRDAHACRLCQPTPCKCLCHWIGDTDGR